MFEGPTKEELQEGNKLIAEFLDWELVNIGDDDDDDFHCWVFKNKRTGQMHDGIDAEFFDKNSTIPFNESWNWLMTAVDRIEDYPIRTRVTIGTTFARIHTGGENIELNCEVFGGKLKATWSAIVEFIKQYKK